MTRICMVCTHTNKTHNKV